jgi:hypothetical protein
MFKTGKFWVDDSSGITEACYGHWEEGLYIETLFGPIGIMRILLRIGIIIFIGGSLLIALLPGR